MARMASHDRSMRPHDRAPIAASARLARDTHAPITTRRVVFNTRRTHLMRIVVLSSSRARPFASTNGMNAKMRE